MFFPFFTLFKCLFSSFLHVFGYFLSLSWMFECFFILSCVSIFDFWHFVPFFVLLHIFLFLFLRTSRSEKKHRRKVPVLKNTLSFVKTQFWASVDRKEVRNGQFEADPHFHVFHVSFLNFSDFSFFLKICFSFFSSKCISLPTLVPECNF